MSFHLIWFHYKEDDCRIRKDDEAENSFIIIWLCFNVAKLHPKKACIRGKHRMAEWGDEFKAELVFGAIG